LGEFNLVSCPGLTASYGNKYLRALRLQALDQMNIEQLQHLASETGKPKLLRAVQVIKRIVEEETLD
jgi:hypothetical protein